LMSYDMHDLRVVQNDMCTFLFLQIENWMLQIANARTGHHDNHHSNGKKSVQR